MNRRLLVAATVLGAAALTGVAFAPRAEAQRGGPSFGSATLTPKTLNSIGGTVKVRLKISSSVAITSVRSRATVPGTLNSGPTANLTDNGRGVYSGSIQVPANLNKKAQNSNVFVSVTTANGTVERKVGTVKLKANTNDPSTPPPPPPI